MYQVGLVVGNTLYSRFCGALFGVRQHGVTEIEIGQCRGCGDLYLRLPANAATPHRREIQIQISSVSLAGQSEFCLQTFQFGRQNSAAPDQTVFSGTASGGTATIGHQIANNFFGPANPRAATVHTGKQRAIGDLAFLA